MTDSITGLTSTSLAAESASAPTASQTSATGLADDFSTFLTLLTTQLQNQDPLDPLDSNEFTDQLVQFTSVEQQIQTNANLEDLNELVANNTLAGIAGFLGQEATIIGNSGTHEGNGILFEVGFDEVPETLLFNVVNADGDIVFQADGVLRSGLQAFQWDGTDGLGNLLPDGVYSLQVAATSGGEALLGTTFVQDQITAINTEGREPLLSVGNAEVRQDDILRLVAGTSPLGQVAATTPAAVAEDPAP